MVYCAHSNTGRNVNTYFILSLYTGRLLRDGQGNLIAIQGRTERAAKAAYTRTGRYVNWQTHSLVDGAVP